MIPPSSSNTRPDERRPHGLAFVNERSIVALLTIPNPSALEVEGQGIPERSCYRRAIPIARRPKPSPRRLVIRFENPKTRTPKRGEGD